MLPGVRVPRRPRLASRLVGRRAAQTTSGSPTQDRACDRRHAIQQVVPRSPSRRDRAGRAAGPRSSSSTRRLQAQGRPAPRDGRPAHRRYAGSSTSSRSCPRRRTSPRDRLPSDRRGDEFSIPTLLRRLGLVVDFVLDASAASPRAGGPAVSERRASAPRRSQVERLQDVSPRTHAASARPTGSRRLRGPAPERATTGVGRAARARPEPVPARSRPTSTAPG